MKKLTCNMGVRVLAAILAAASLFAAVLSGAAALVLLDEGFFYSTEEDIVRDCMIKRMCEDMDYAWDYFLVRENSYGIVEYYEEIFSEENTNFFFTVTDEEGNVVFKSYDCDRCMMEVSEKYSIADGDGTVENYTITGYLKTDFGAKDAYWMRYKTIQFAYSSRYGFAAVFAGSFLATVLLMIFLAFAAGRKKDKEGYSLTWFDRVPLDILTAIAAVAVIFTVSLFAEPVGVWMQDPFTMVLSLAAAFLSALILQAFFVTVCARIKCGKWWRGTVIWLVLYLAVKILRKTGAGIKFILGNIPLYWKTAAVVLILFLINLAIAVINWYSGSGMVFALCIWWLGLMLFAAVCVINMQQLKKGGEKIASGELDYKIDTKNMLPEFKKHAENLNNISAGLQNAVEQQMKSERMKTELITNVSHDLKTPLTSIVNYVDLLKKENVSSPKAAEYVEVLERHANRLKRLTEDLVEASKASTGNVQIKMEKMDLGVLITQTAGEFEEKLTAASLKLVIRGREQAGFVMADGRHLWRVFENLMNNVCKYAMEGTRVYIDIDKTAGGTAVSFKNVSRDELNISPDELTERFVRGDASRNTEGSGLGLSIAKNLTELQGGRFEISTDGDLFKASVELAPAV